MKKSVITGLGVGISIGAVIKVVVLTLVSILAIGLAIYLAVQGRWGAAALVIFVGEPILVFLADLATGLLIAVFAGVGAVAGTVVPSSRTQTYRGEDDETAWEETSLESLNTGPIQEMHDRRFTEATERWLALRETGEGVPKESQRDVRPALIGMSRAVMKTPLSPTTVTDEESRQYVAALGEAGYVWRVAESTLSDWGVSHVRKPVGVADELLPMTPWGKRLELIEQTRSIVRSVEEQGVPRQVVLELSALICVARERLPLGNGSPGGIATGGDFLRQAQSFVEAELSDMARDVGLADRRYAFSFGVAVFDCEQAI